MPCDHERRIIQFLWIRQEHGRDAYGYIEYPEGAEPVAHLNARFMATCLCGEKQGHVSQWEGLAEALRDPIGSVVTRRRPLPPSPELELQRLEHLFNEARWTEREQIPGCRIRFRKPDALPGAAVKSGDLPAVVWEKDDAGCWTWISVEALEDAPAPKPRKRGAKPPTDQGSLKL
jgi:hypothetical protein